MACFFTSVKAFAFLRASVISSTLVLIILMCSDIFSSICFETWYLLHFKNSTKVFTSEAELEKELKKCIGMENYEKNNFKHYSILKDKLAIAKSNAEKTRLVVFENNHDVEVFNLNPYTNVDELVDFLEKQKQ